MWTILPNEKRLGYCCCGCRLVVYIVLKIILTFSIRKHLDFQLLLRIINVPVIELIVNYEMEHKMLILIQILKLKK